MTYRSIAHLHMLPSMLSYTKQGKRTWYLCLRPRHQGKPYPKLPVALAWVGHGSSAQSLPFPPVDEKLDVFITECVHSYGLSSSIQY
ncbi:hypothetical protein LOK49_LG09G02317 [Camellia lanceoleosa]|uniref:Uncharacterized protein n=1 Tax=Camellia lanceoleosa TaxID=1840588 RepID=A0ACC0GJ21_9ERIC|nr:hypothetical protein LOK49_LG09G02317 [Camellia lanceoleosa]